MITLKKIYILLFFVGLFFFPFNSFEGLKFLGEYKNESGAYFFLIGFVFLIIDSLFKGKISIPFNRIVFKVLILFLLWCIVCSLINYKYVSVSFLKHTTGFNRFIRQYISLLFSTIIFFILYWNVIREMSSKEILYKFRKTLLYCLLFASFYGFLQLAIFKFGINIFYPILKAFNYFPFLEDKLCLDGRISSVAFEPPFLAVYLISIAGWMFSYILTESSKIKYIPTSLVLILTYYSGSRTALIVVTIQLLVFLAYILNRKQKIIGASFLVTIIFILSVSSAIFSENNALRDISKKIESLDFKSNLKKSISNQSRFGMQYATLKVFADHPVVGVGFGQQAYYSRYYYPGWAKADNWEFKYLYMNSKELSFPPGYNLYTRLLAETGIIGITIFILLIYVTIKQSKNLSRSEESEKKIFGLILLVTFVGIYINWLQIDTFRVYIYWVSLCVLMKISNQKLLKAKTN